MISIYVEDVLEPAQFVRELQGKGKRPKPSACIRKQLSDSACRWLKRLSPESLDKAEIAQLVSELNIVLKEDDLFESRTGTPADSAASPSVTENQTIRSNREQLEKLFPAKPSRGSFCRRPPMKSAT